MEYIHRLPFILGTIMTIIVALISLKFDVPSQDTYIRMAVSMAGFFTLGLYIRNILIKINEDIEKKKKEEEERKALEEQEELERQHAELMKAKEITENKEKIASTIDFRVDDNSEEFSPLKVSEILSSKIE